MTAAPEFQPAPAEPSSNERELFRDAVGKVRRLHSDRLPGAPGELPLARSRLADEQAVLEELLTGPEHPDNGEAIEYCRPGLQHTLLRRLKRGEFRIDANLDLHGMTVPVARAALAAFLSARRSPVPHCVRIVHGKGLRSGTRGPVLKGKLPRWLCQRAEVLAYCSAPPRDGGSGALYVLLRRAAGAAAAHPG